MKDIRYLKPDNTKIKNLQNQRRVLTFIFLIIFASSLYLIFHRFSGTPENRDEKTHFPFTKLDSLLNKNFNRINKLDLNFLKHETEDIAYIYPSSTNRRSLLLNMKNFLTDNGYNIHKMVTLPQGRGLGFHLEAQGQTGSGLYLIQKGKINNFKKYLRRKFSKPPRLAIIINNFGYNQSPLYKNFMSLPADITIAITPGNLNTKWSQQIATGQGKEIIIHMPMEAQNTDLGANEKYWLSDSMSQELIRANLDSAANELSLAFGLDNYMGSKATSNLEFVETLMSWIDKKGLYFIDNLNCLESVAYTVAKNRNIPAGVRNVFINNRNSPKVIRNNLDKAIKIARQSGKAIAVGRATQNTFSVMQEYLEANKFEDIVLCFASEIVL
jgi:polysaccharide deacetylase 2 family uncharacterized protein YibQ